VRVLILGSKGQLGSSILEKFDDQATGGSFMSAFSREELDVTDVEQMEKEFEIFRPDTVVNCAAWTDVEGAESQYTLARDINYLGVVNVMRVAEKYNTRIIQISTDYVFDGSHETPIGESEIQNPINRYGESKADAERFLLQEYRENSIIIRTAWLYGPYGKNFARTMIRKALTIKEETIGVVNDQQGQPTSTLDLATRILEIADSNVQSGIFHGTNSGSTSWFGFAKLLLDSAEIGSERLVPVPSSDFPSSVNRPKYSVLGQEGWSSINYKAMRPWEDAIKDIALRIRREVEEANGI
jgi:dTDP-4-dehydrorhamnose reductase